MLYLITVLHFDNASRRNVRFRKSHFSTGEILVLEGEEAESNSCSSKTGVGVVHWWQLRAEKVLQGWTLLTPIIVTVGMSGRRFGQLRALVCNSVHHKSWQYRYDYLKCSENSYGWELFNSKRDKWWKSGVKENKSPLWRDKTWKVMWECDKIQNSAGCSGIIGTSGNVTDHNVQSDSASTSGKQAANLPAPQNMHSI